MSLERMLEDITRAHRRTYDRDPGGFVLWAVRSAYNQGRRDGYKDAAENIKKPGQRDGPGKRAVGKWS